MPFIQLLKHSSFPNSSETATIIYLGLFFSGGLTLEKGKTNKKTRKIISFRLTFFFSLILYYLPTYCFYIHYILLFLTIFDIIVCDLLPNRQLAFTGFFFASSTSTKNQAGKKKKIFDFFLKNQFFFRFWKNPKINRHLQDSNLRVQRTMA